jgi:hypothetical protein
MKHLLLTALLLCLYETVDAGWTALDKRYQPTGLETIYFDPDTIHQQNGLASLWQLADIKWNSTTRFLSSKTHKEFECEGSRVRVLQVITFSRQMGSGRSTSGYIENGNWQPVIPGTVNYALWEVACGKHSPSAHAPLPSRKTLPR